MKLHHGFAVLLLGTLATAPMALAQAGAASGGGITSISSEIKTSAKLDDAQAKQVQQFVTDQCAQLADSTNPTGQSAARDRIAAALQVAGKEISPAFRDIFTTALTQQLAPLADSTDVRVRLLTGIVDARVAERADVGAVKLAPLTQKLMSDKLDAVALWGMKAASFIIPVELRDPAAKPDLLATIVPTVAQHPSGAIAAEAYRALAPAPAPTDPGQLTRLISPMLQLLDLRIAQYQKAVPDEPLQDATATTFLSSGPVWARLSDEQKTAAVQRICGLLAAASKRMSTDDRSTVELLNRLVNLASSALSVIATAQKADALSAAVQPLLRVSMQTAPADVQAMVAKLYPAAKAAFPGLQVPAGG